MCKTYLRLSAHVCQASLGEVCDCTSAPNTFVTISKALERLHALFNFVKDDNIPYYVFVVFIFLIS